MPSWIETVLEWLIDVLLWVPREIFKLVLGALANLINSIPVPDFIANLGSTIGNAFGQIAWFGELFMIPEGLAIVLSAALIRFFIRRLPVVG